MNISISTFTDEDLQPTISMLKHNMEVMFPLLPSKSSAEIWEEFKKDFIHDPLGLFLLAKDRKRNIVATIAMRTYDNRFKQFEVTGQKVVEVVKLFVNPAFRRFGLGSLMFKTLELEAFKKDNDQLYLHTHRFLPGAESFWAKQGFVLLHDQGGDLQTVHFSKGLTSQPPVPKAQHSFV